MQWNQMKSMIRTPPQIITLPFSYMKKKNPMNVIALYTIELYAIIICHCFLAEITIRTRKEGNTHTLTHIRRCVRALLLSLKEALVIYFILNSSTNRWIIKSIPLLLKSQMRREWREWRIGGNRLNPILFQNCSTSFPLFPPLSLSLSTD